MRLFASNLLQDQLTHVKVEFRLVLAFVDSLERQSKLIDLGDFGEQGFEVFRLIVELLSFVLSLEDFQLDLQVFIEFKKGHSMEIPPKEPHLAGVEELEHKSQILEDAARRNRQLPLVLLTCFLELLNHFQLICVCLLSLSESLPKDVMHAENHANLIQDQTVHLQ